MLVAAFVFAAQPSRTTAVYMPAPPTSLLAAAILHNLHAGDISSATITSSSSKDVAPTSNRHRDAPPPAARDSTHSAESADVAAVSTTSISDDPPDFQAAKAAFLQQYGQDYGYGGWLDANWHHEVQSRFGPHMQHYLDFTGSALFTRSHIRCDVVALVFLLFVAINRVLRTSPTHKSQPRQLEDGTRAGATRMCSHHDLTLCVAGCCLNCCCSLCVGLQASCWSSTPSATRTAATPAAWRLSSRCRRRGRGCCSSSTRMRQSTLSFGQGGCGCVEHKALFVCVLGLLGDVCVLGCVCLRLCSDWQQDTPFKVQPLPSPLRAMQCRTTLILAITPLAPQPPLHSNVLVHHHRALCMQWCHCRPEACWRGLPLDLTTGLAASSTPHPRRLQ